jgi:hypothetical protein
MKSFVYLIYNEDTDTPNYVKIGKADDVMDRFSGLQTSNPNKLRIAAILECRNSNHALSVEGELHKKYTHLRLRGEWFHWSSDILKEFENLIDNNNLLYKKIRDPLINNTLWENEKTKFSVDTFPPCFFYPHLSAQIYTNYEDAQRLSVPWRTMEFPTNGKQMLIGPDGRLWSDKVNRVFISGKKHQENMQLKTFLKLKHTETKDLEVFCE